jgi:hypothetical protein
MPDKPIGKRAWVAGKIGLFRFSAAQLLASLALLCCGYAFLELLPGGDIIASVMLTLVLFSAVLAVGLRRQQLLISIALGLPPLVTEWLRHASPGLLPPWLSDVSVLAFIVYSAIKILSAILRAQKVDQEILCAGASVYFLMILAWSFAYRVSADVNPGAFSVHATGGLGGRLSPFDSLYYSIVTVTTLGCNDITPASRGARTLTMLQVMAGMFYATVFIARLVALYSRKMIAPNLPTKPEPPGKN